jgi:hypothetical protein
MKPLTIVELRAENLMRLKAITIRPRPDGSLVIIGGKNAQGKSSVLNAIWMACGGKDAVPAEPVRRGAAKGLARVDLGEIVVERTFTTKGSYLKVTGADGVPVKSPQALMDSLVGCLSFDPLAFARMDPKAQADQLKRAVGLDLQGFDDDRANLYEERRGVSRDLKQAEAELAGAKRYPDAPAEAVSVVDLANDLERAQANNEMRRAALQEAVTCQAAAVREAQELKEMERRIGELKNRLQASVKAKESADQRADQIIPIDVAPLRAAIASASETNAKIQANNRYAALEAKATSLRSQVDQYTATIADIDEAKAKMIADAHLPVEGLGLDDTGVTLNGLPFAQASDAEKLKVSVALGLACNPKLRVLLIRDGSLLDEDSLAVLEKMGAGAQLWIERVGEGDKTAVIIEDGAVKEG